ncbi:MAG: flavin reductase family protein [Nocardioides sp.]|uniref:flavin reductase family protein n=1 Tax=Nocardioides sp. TaxID=35761 RepID=UPI0039E42E28
MSAVPTESGVLTEQFRDAMAHLCAPVTVVTACEQGRAHGTTVSAFASLSLHPQLVTVALDRSSRLLEVVERTGRFGVNVLSTDQASLAMRFAGKGDDKFDEVTWLPEGQLPRLPRSVAWLRCSTEEILGGGDHLILVGRVEHCEVDVEQPPLSYFGRRFGTHAPLAP